MLIRDFIPPIILKMKNKFLNTNQPGSEPVPHLFASYDEARTFCTNNGYEQEELIETIYQKTKYFRTSLEKERELIVTDSMLQPLNALFLSLMSRSLKDEINIIDLGGACGAHYFIAKTILKDYKLRWHVVETPQMVKKAKTLETDELQFFENIPSAFHNFNHVDLFHSSGTLQYVPDYEKNLSEIFDTNAKYLFLSRLALNSGDSPIFIIQESRMSDNGPGPLPIGIMDRLCRYPSCYIPSSWFEEKISSHYRVIMRFPEPNIELTGKTLIISAGLFAERL